MLIFWITLMLFIDFIIYLVLFDIILSWLRLLWINFRPTFVSNILDPLYNFINSKITTRFWPFRFDAFILVILLYLIQYFLISILPWLEQEIINLTNNFTQW
jgi:hypothetical protein